MVVETVGLECSPQHSVIGKVLNGHRKWELWNCGVSGITTYQTFKVVLAHRRKSTMGLTQLEKKTGRELLMYGAKPRCDAADDKRHLITDRNFPIRIPIK